MLNLIRTFNFNIDGCVCEGDEKEFDISVSVKNSNGCCNVKIEDGKGNKSYFSNLTPVSNMFKLFVANDMTLLKGGRDYSLCSIYEFPEESFVNVSSWCYGLKDRFNEYMTKLNEIK